MKTIPWRREPKGPGRNAQQMFLDAGGERVELLAFDVPATPDCGRMCAFEVFAREKPNSKYFYKLLADGEASDLAAAQAAALEMVARPREQWATIDKRSWQKKESK